MVHVLVKIILYAQYHAKFWVRNVNTDLPSLHTGWVTLLLWISGNIPASQAGDPRSKLLRARSDRKKYSTTEGSSI